MQNKRIIGMTDGRMYDLYANWIKGADDGIEIIRVGYALDNFSEVEKCQALVFTGGEDVHPRRYGRLDYLPYCVPGDFDEQRDAFEWKLLEDVVQRKLPILGVCRGLQLINVFHGGTLIPDIPSWGKFHHAKLPDGNVREHHIYVDPQSELAGLVQCTEGTVNSLHHQSADKIGKDLVASAISKDGVVEALEWKDKQDKPFLCLVQWHPERMADTESPFVRNIREAFLDSVK
ncbi:gamma-glutamyl-gamma-aminobutyrate hydrolase family protein [Olivibacter sp. XZL3]|uniref:gamma-glutamyl-gamma-aminobutyrate hydrolase family protein n=1 Tax=Olivibacter sp. XZL3 TaxID=1735116 RepID=UPI0010654FAC|nr:gamma-glutamyl-gamma-aminobutyrate hydrolase family protein [Olivibacter sp. XZL3]